MCMYRLLVLSSSAVSIQGQVVGSMASRISYTVPRTEGGLVCLIKADVHPVMGTSFAINISNALQWDLHTQSAARITLASDAVRLPVSGSSESSQLSQSKPLWALSSECDYGGGSFNAVASETLSKSFVATTGQYSFNDSKNW